MSALGDLTNMGGGNVLLLALGAILALVGIVFQMRDMEREPD
jgi:hypothetical protein